MNDGFGMAMAHLYVQQSYKKSTEASIREMIYYLKKAFRQIIMEQAWLQEGFKSELIEKVRCFHFREVFTASMSEHL